MLYVMSKIWESPCFFVSFSFVSSRLLLLLLFCLLCNVNGTNRKTIQDPSSFVTLPCKHNTTQRETHTQKLHRTISVSPATTTTTTTTTDYLMHLIQCDNRHPTPTSNLQLKKRLITSTCTLFQLQSTTISFFSTAFVAKQPVLLSSIFTIQHSRFNKT